MVNEIKNEAFERVQLARHPERPYSLDLFTTLFDNFVEIHGDRRYADDAAMICGFAEIGGQEVLVVGQQKGRDINERRFRNFAMTKPEGYRKALRAMRLADKFNRPIICLIDTPGAYPGIDAEERGQAEAIAFNLREMASFKVPIIVVVLGEGGSGGALAIGIGDRILMMENAVYSVITPEGCAAILWKDATQSARAAECLRLTAVDLAKFGLIDEVISEQSAWSFSDTNTNNEDKSNDGNFNEIAEVLKTKILKHLNDLKQMSSQELVLNRFQKFRMMGEWIG